MKKSPNNENINNNSMPTNLSCNSKKPDRTPSPSSNVSYEYTKTLCLNYKINRFHRYIKNKFEITYYILETRIYLFIIFTCIRNILHYQINK